jgi:hypothetical protein
MHSTARLICNPYLNATPVLLREPHCLLPVVLRHYSRYALAQKSLSELPANCVTAIRHSGSPAAIVHSTYSAVVMLSTAIKSKTILINYTIQVDLERY